MLYKYSKSLPINTLPVPPCNGRLIVFEGIDGSGTTTQSRILTKRLQSANLSAKYTREPGGTIFSELIRKILLSPNTKIDAITEMLMYAAVRSDHVKELIRPSLSLGYAVVSDRFVDSSIAYQGFGRNLGPSLVGTVNKIAVGECLPDIVFYLLLPVSVAIKRQAKRKTNPDRMEMEGIQFLKKVADGYCRIAEKNREQGIILNAELPPEVIATTVWKELVDRWT